MHKRAIEREGTAWHGVPHAALRSRHTCGCGGTNAIEKEGRRRMGNWMKRGRGELTRLVAERPTIKVSEGERERERRVARTKVNNFIDVVAVIVAICGGKNEGGRVCCYTNCATLTLSNG